MFMVVLILVHASYSEYKEEVNDHSSEGCPRFLRNNTVWISREKKRYIETNDRVFRVCDDAGLRKTARKGGWSEVTRGKIIIRAKAGREKMRCG